MVEGLRPGDSYSAVLFDFDGVLGRTLEDNYAAWASALGRHGIPISAEEYYLLEGAGPLQVAETMLRKHSRETHDAAEIVAAKERFYAAHNSFSFYDGAVPLIERLRETGVKLGLVSGALRRRLRDTCGEQFLERFAAVVTSEDVNQGKPNPEPYLRAAQKLAVEPGDCLVVENAPLGIRSARSAGMDCVAITSTLDRRFLGEANAVIASLSELTPALFRVSG
jgi:beta-phosphoglucomutase